MIYNFQMILILECGLPEEGARKRRSSNREERRMNFGRMQSSKYKWRVCIIASYKILCDGRSQLRDMEMAHESSLIITTCLTLSNRISFLLRLVKLWNSLFQSSIPIEKNYRHSNRDTLALCLPSD